MKQLLENWKKYLNEREQIEMSPEENQAIKGLYLKIRELVLHFSNWAQENNFDFNTIHPSPIRKTYNPPVGFKKAGVEFSFDVSNFKKVFPNLSDDFFVKLNATNPDKKEGGSLHRVGDEIVSMGLNVKRFDDIQNVKMVIQHELQHLLDWGGDKEEGAEGTEGAEGAINYLTSEGEVRAHAKEAAYYFFKTFPDEDFDVEKIKDVKKKYTNYYNFHKDPNGIVSRNNLDTLYGDKMKKAGDNFIKYAEYFLSLFRAKNETTN